MKRISLKALSCLIATGALLTCCSSADAQLIDDFESGDFSAYTTTVILDTDAAGGLNTSALGSNASGNVVFDTTVFQSIEQIAITRSDVTLAIGDELQIDVARGLDADRALRGNQDFGLFVGGTAPIASTVAANDARQNFLTVFQRNGQQDVQTALFNDDFAGGNTDDFGANPAYDTLFIARTGADTYEGGFYDAGTRSVIREEVTITTDAAGPSIGFYADVRGVDTLQSGFDNFRILSAVPEPSSLALLGLASVFGFVRRRRN